MITPAATEDLGVSFVVYGKPEPQGSARGFVLPGKGGARPRAVITSDNPKNKGWRRDVGFAALAARPAGFAPYAGPVCLSVTFHLPRPKALKGYRVLHRTRPDIDKLVRSVSDALSGILYDDDGQIQQIAASKYYADAGEMPCIKVYVRGV